MGRGGQLQYSDFAIETCLTLGLIFGKPLRQTQGFVRSQLKLIGLEMPVPDFSTLSRRAIGLSVSDAGPKSKGPITLIVESTGVSDCLTRQFGPADEITIPPPITAVLGLTEQRDAQIGHIAEHGRMDWQLEPGYNDRAPVEAQIGCRKFVIGPGLNAREMSRQNTENKIATKSLNRMTHLGRAVFKRVA